MQTHKKVAFKMVVARLAPVRTMAQPPTRVATFMILPKLLDYSLDSTSHCRGGYGRATLILRLNSLLCCEDEMRLFPLRTGAGLPRSGTEVAEFSATETCPNSFRDQIRAPLRAESRLGKVTHM